MNQFANEVALAGTVGLRGIHAYLRANGWTLDESRRRKTHDLYLWPGDRREVAIVPAAEEYSDYGKRVYQLAEQLGRVEGRRLFSVLTDLSLGESDLVRICLPNAHKDNTIRLADGVEALKEAKDLLLAAACSAIRPQRMYRAGRNKRAANYMAGVRMGQTEPGSFVISLLSPVPPALRGPFLPDEPDEEPFQRKVTRKLVSGLRALRRAMGQVNRHDAHIGVFEEQMDEGVSANLCRSVARLTEVGNGLEVSVSWAMTRPDESKSCARATVAFWPRDVPALDEAARILSGRQERANEEIEGFVSRLARDKTDHDGTVTIKAYIDGKLAAVQAVFGSADYDEIARAHKDNLPVSLEGDLRRKGQRWHLHNPRGLAVLRDDDG